jgi:hypothetical protein
LLSLTFIAFNLRECGANLCDQNQLAGTVTMRAYSASSPNEAGVMARSTALIVAKRAIKRIERPPGFRIAPLPPFQCAAREAVPESPQNRHDVSEKSARCRRYRPGLFAVLFAVPLRKKANAVRPSSAAIGAGGLSRNANSNPPVVNPAMNTPTSAIIAKPLSHDGGRMWLI